MVTVFGEGRGFRVVWLLEEMGLPYRLRPVDLLAGVEKDTEFLAVNPAGFIPAIQDGEVTMVESIAIMEYLMARYGPTPLAPDPHDPVSADCNVTRIVEVKVTHLGEYGGFESRRDVDPGASRGDVGFEEAGSIDPADRARDGDGSQHGAQVPARAREGAVRPARAAAVQARRV